MKELVELCNALENNSEDAAQAAMLEGRAKESANQGFKALSDVQATLKYFVGSTHDIDILLEEIQSLTLQVHILGVNAAVEAANAGQHGDGFSIIAIEMRRIAKMVKEAAGKTQELLQSSGTLADETVNAIDMASEALELLETSADLSIELTTTVAERAKEQANFLRKITNNERGKEQGE